MCLQGTNPDQELLRKILKDQQLGKERFEDMLLKFKELSPDLTDDEFKAKKEAAMIEGKIAHEIQLKCQQYTLLAFTEGPEVAHKFADSQGSLRLSTEQNKRLREIKKDTPKSSNRGAPQEDEYQSPRKRAATASVSFQEQQWRQGLLKKQGKWAPHINRCNSCDDFGHRQIACPRSISQYSLPPPRPAQGAGPSSSGYYHPPGRN